MHEGDSRPRGSEQGLVRLWSQARAQDEDEVEGQQDREQHLAPAERAVKVEMKCVV